MAFPIPLRLLINQNAPPPQYTTHQPPKTTSKTRPIVDPYAPPSHTTTYQPPKPTPKSRPLLQTRQISPLFTSPHPTSPTTPSSFRGNTDNRQSLLTLVTSTHQNVTVKIYATSHTFSTTVPLSSAKFVLPAYLSGVVGALGEIPAKQGERGRAVEIGDIRGRNDRYASRSRTRDVSRSRGEREMRIKVCILHGWKFFDGESVNGEGAGDADSGYGGEGYGEEIEYLFFGTKDGVLERFPFYLEAVLGMDEDLWAVEKVNERFSGEGDVEVQDVGFRGRKGERIMDERVAEEIRYREKRMDERAAEEIQYREQRRNEREDAENRREMDEEEEWKLREMVERIRIEEERRGRNGDEDRAQRRRERRARHEEKERRRQERERERQRDLDEDVGWF